MGVSNVSLSFGSSRRSPTPAANINKAAITAIRLASFAMQPTELQQGEQSILAGIDRRLTFNGYSENGYGLMLLE
jgi:hypothetical protein